MDRVTVSMDRALAADVDLRGHLRAVQAMGATFAERVLAEDFRLGLEDEVQAGPFEPLPQFEGRAQQEGELFGIGDDTSGYPRVSQLRDELAELVRVHGREFAGLTAWWPNEVGVQRYPAQAVGITPHLDLKRYTHLVAVFTVAGSAPFTVCKNRAGEALVRWWASAGSLVLMRGPGFGGVEDGRPLHMVGGPESGQRISVTFRMNSRPE